MRAAIATALLACAMAVQAQTEAERLFQLISEGKEPVAAVLVLGGKVDVHARNAARETPLHAAAENGMQALVRLLIGAGSNLRARTETGESPLHLAALPEDPAFTWPAGIGKVMPCSACLSPYHSEKSSTSTAGRSFQTTSWITAGTVSPRAIRAKPLFAERCELGGAGRLIGSSVGVEEGEDSGISADD